MNNSFTWMVAACLAGLAPASLARTDGDEDLAWLELGEETVANESGEAAANDSGDTAANDSGDTAAVTQEADKGSKNILDSIQTLYADENIKLKFGGRIMWDWGWFHADPGHPSGEEDGTEFRRARINTTGKIYNIGFKAQYDFAPAAQLGFNDVYMDWESPIGKLRLGHFKEPMGLEQLTSSRFITFMERAMPIEALTPERNAGAMLSGTVGEGTGWQVFGGRDTVAFGRDTGDGEYVGTARLTQAIWNRDQGREVLHVGVSGSYRAGDALFRTRPEAHLVGVVVDTADPDAKDPSGEPDPIGARPADGTVLYGAEAAWVQGPLSIQGEFIGASISEFGGPGMPDADLTGWYAFVSYFLTGEGRTYKKAKFDRVRPGENWDGGFNGAWEVAVRYSSVDFDDTATFNTPTYTTGQSDGITVGLNWYLNPYSRVMFNYVHNTFENEKTGNDEAFDAFMMRFQLDW